MCINYTSYIWHTAIAYFNVISIEYFMQLMSFRKMLCYQVKKFLCDISFNVYAIWLVIPYNLSYSTSSPSVVYIEFPRQIRLRLERCYTMERSASNISLLEEILLIRHEILSGIALIIFGG